MIRSLSYHAALGHSYNAGNHLIEIFGVERLGERCRAHDVAKENREVPSLAAGNEIGFAWRRQPRCRRGETIRGPRSNRQAGAAASAKPTFWQVHSPALNAFGGQYSAALRAEAPTLRIIRVTAQAFHEAGPVAYSRGCFADPERPFSLSTFKAKEYQVLRAVQDARYRRAKSSVDHSAPRRGALRLLLVFIF
jgi:hypothetical protein